MPSLPPGTAPLGVGEWNGVGKGSPGTERGLAGLGGLAMEQDSSELWSPAHLRRGCGVLALQGTPNS